MNKTSASARRRELKALIAEHGYASNAEDGKNLRVFAERVGYAHGSVRKWVANTKYFPSRHTLRTIRLLLTQPTE
jgi:hypothetical protein